MGGLCFIAHDLSPARTQVNGHSSSLVLSPGSLDLVSPHRPGLPPRVWRVWWLWIAQASTVWAISICSDGEREGRGIPMM